MFPRTGSYGTGLVFLPVNEEEAEFCIKVLNRYTEAEGLKLICWRDVPIDNSVIGEIAKKAEPLIKQIFVKGNYEQDTLERKLYLVRKQAERTIRESDLNEKEIFHMPSFSTKVIVYKGMFTPSQFRDYYKDLRTPGNEKCNCTGTFAFQHKYFPHMGPCPAFQSYCP